MMPRACFKFAMTMLGVLGVTVFAKVFQSLSREQTKEDLTAVRRGASENGASGHLLHFKRIPHYTEKTLPTVSTSSADTLNIYDRQKLLQEFSVRLKEMHSSSPPTQTNSNEELPTIFVVTPTYRRFLQKAELTRVAQTFKHVAKLHWIVVEDAHEKTDLVARFLRESGLRYTHLNARTPKSMRILRGQPRFFKSRGVEQRNLALDWLRKNVNSDVTKGVVYFADDDNTYDVRIFDEIRDVKKVGVWPVAFTGAARWAGPVCRGGKVVGFHTNWKPFRPFPIDMAAFAVNIRKLLVEKPNARFDPNVHPGFLETSFLEQLTTKDELEPKADNCLKVYVWHTRTEVPWINISGERQLVKRGKPSNREVET